MITKHPEIPGLIFRRIRGESDYDAIAVVLTGSSIADNINREVSGKDIAAAFINYISNWDPYTDTFIAEVAGEMAGYTRGSRMAERIARVK